MIKIRDIMTKDAITIQKEAGIIEAAKIITGKATTGLVVVENGKPIAIITESGIITALLSRKTKAMDVMEKDFMVISPEEKFSQISGMLMQQRIKIFPVVENEKLAGIVTETDIIEATRDFTRVHQIVQNVILAIFGLATSFFLFYFSPLRATIFS